MIRFRRAAFYDVDALVELYAAGREVLKESGIDQWQDGYPFREDIEKDIEGGRLYLACNGDDIYGAAAVIDEGDFCYDEIDGAWLTDSDSKDPRYLTVHRMVVDPTKGRKGIASRLFNVIELTGQSSGYDSVRVDTHNDNFRMRALLKKCGYAECGIVDLGPARNAPALRVAYEKVIG